MAKRGPKPRQDSSNYIKNLDAEMRPINEKIKTLEKEIESLKKKRAEVSLKYYKKNILGFSISKWIPNSNLLWRANGRINGKTVCVYLGDSPYDAENKIKRHLRKIGASLKDMCK